MMRSHAYQNKGVAVFGLGKSGLSTARCLHAGQAHVHVWDDNLTGREAAIKAGLPVQDFHGGGWPDTDILVLSPGVPLTHPNPHPVVQYARQENIAIIGDIEVFLAEKAAGKVVGITGTNGKSTTSVLIYHILKIANMQTALGGNIGTPVMDLPQLDEDGVYVLELSSYQLDLTPSWRADVAVLLNITPDHLDRHGDMVKYAAIKRRIFQHQQGADIAIIGVDDAICREIADELVQTAPQNVIRISVKARQDYGISVIDAVLEDSTVDGDIWRFDISTIDALRGAHNGQNAAAAVAVCRALGVQSDDIASGLRSFGGLAHRMELVCRKNNVRFVNDSKATNAEAADKSLAAFDHIFWICGGRSKTGGIESLERHFTKIEHAYLIGDCAEEFARTLAGKVPFSLCETMDVAVAMAMEAALTSLNEATVLLAPAAASFDQFKSFEARGDAFRALVTGGVQ